MEENLAIAKDKMMRALADAENARTIAKRDVENANQFAVTKFAKSLLSVADNLTLAVDAIAHEVSPLSFLFFSFLNCFQKLVSYI
jgi:molecular chaperone GrpE